MPGYIHLHRLVYIMFESVVTCMYINIFVRTQCAIDPCFEGLHHMDQEKILLDNHRRLRILRADHADFVVSCQAKFSSLVSLYFAVDIGTCTRRLQKLLTIHLCQKE